MECCIIYNNPAEELNLLLTLALYQLFEKSPWSNFSEDSSNL